MTTDLVHIIIGVSSYCKHDLDKQTSGYRVITHNIIWCIFCSEKYPTHALMHLRGPC